MTQALDEGEQRVLMAIMRESFLLFPDDERHEAQCQLIQAALLTAGSQELQLNWWLEQLRG